MVVKDEAVFFRLPFVLVTIGFSETLAHLGIIYYNISIYGCYNGVGTVHREGDIKNGKEGSGDQRALYFIITYTIFTLQSNSYSNEGTVYPYLHRIFRRLYAVLQLCETVCQIAVAGGLCT